MSQPARIVVASVAEVGRTKAEKDSKRAAVSTLVLHKLSPMMLTDLKQEIDIVTYHGIISFDAVNLCDFILFTIIIFFEIVIFFV